LEADILGKYIEKLMVSSSSPNAADNTNPDELTPAFLIENGYL
jgi:hypothetical protein